MSKIKILNNNVIDFLEKKINCENKDPKEVYDSLVNLKRVMIPMIPRTDIYQKMSNCVDFFMKGKLVFETHFYYKVIVFDETDHQIKSFELSKNEYCLDEEGFLEPTSCNSSIKKVWVI